MTGVWLWRWRVPCTRGVKLHESGYWDVGFCTGVGGSVVIGSSVGVDGADGVGSVGGVGSGYGNSDSAGSIGES